ncbi:MAG TPA: hypothetical protein VGG38_21090 [Acidimicrobiales bacterium]|jgi:cation:H+ antiporter
MTETLAGVAFPLAAAAALVASFVLATRLERLAERWHLSEVMLGLVIALAADSPEITSAITASVHGQRNIGAGVVLGSNVFNLAALLGLGAMVAGRIALHRRVVLVEGLVAVWTALVTVLVVCLGVAVGVGLALELVAIIPYVIVSAAPTGGLAARLPKGATSWLQAALDEEAIELSDSLHPTKTSRSDGLVAVIAMAVVVGSSIVMERSGQRLGTEFHLSALVVGGVVLAAVTSLPNAVGAIYLARRGRGSAVLSEATNSNMLNVLAGFLLPGVFVGISATSGSGTLVATWYAALTLLCLLIAFARRGMSWAWGAVIVAGYVAFVALAVTR